MFKRLQLAPFLLAPSFVENSSELDLGNIFYGDHIFGDIWEIIKVSDDKIGRAIYPRYQDTQLPSPLPQWGKEPSYAKPISSEVKSEVTCRSNIEQVRIVQFCSFFKITHTPLSRNFFQKKQDCKERQLYFGRTCWTPWSRLTGVVCPAGALVTPLGHLRRSALDHAHAIHQSIHLIH